MRNVFNEVVILVKITIEVAEEEGEAEQRLCQLCGKNGHVVSRCYKQFDQNFQCLSLSSLTHNQPSQGNSNQTQQSHRSPHNAFVAQQEGIFATKSLELLFSDVWGPAPVLYCYLLMVTNTILTLLIPTLVLLVSFL